MGGLNLEVWSNMYIGLERMAREGWQDGDEAVLDLMYYLNSPTSGRVQMARELYKDRPVEEYADALRRARQYWDEGETWENGILNAARREKNEKRMKQDMEEFVWRGANEEERARIRIYERDLERLKTAGEEELQQIYDHPSSPAIRRRARQALERLARPEKPAPTPQQQLEEATGRCGARAFQPAPPRTCATCYACRKGFIPATASCPRTCAAIKQSSGTRQSRV